MPRELDVFGILLPTLIPLLLASVVLQGLLDKLLAGVYRAVWHPALVRLSLLTCIFCGLTLLLS
ncbi:DUF1656 domain-containing protein [Pseudoduganella ginsengisoli]|uniref:DUF1656 domain-containing protein n=1 Tax=Pseudoduganella ginsengisoli TaxID=1462440 RepID=A0A6L6Q4D4_9BURK|nr:DUF1656 domain-containing protein [Pseudoduganella ginsengisoli]MTW04078.1 DUF1656 domain-containing protein [Pseudoduganella ginsengisoli]